MLYNSISMKQKTFLHGIMECLCGIFFTFTIDSLRLSSLYIQHIKSNYDGDWRAVKLILLPKSCDNLLCSINHDDGVLFSCCVYRVIKLKYRKRIYKCQAFCCSSKGLMFFIIVKNEAHKT